MVLESKATTHIFDTGSQLNLLPIFMKLYQEKYMKCSISYPSVYQETLE